MSASDSSESNIAKLIFQNIGWAGVGDATGLVPSTVAGSLYIALHSADPGEAGTQATSELTYTGYARVAVVRSAVGWTLSGTAPTQVANAAIALFGAMTAGGPQTATHFSIGKTVSGATEIVTSAALGAPLIINNGTAPQFAIGTLVATVD